MFYKEFLGEFFLKITDELNIPRSEYTPGAYKQFMQSASPFQPVLTPLSKIPRKYIIFMLKQKFDYSWL